jgi:hypothetical protein
MKLVERKIVEELVASTDPEAALVYECGCCRVVPGSDAANMNKSLVIIQRRDLATLFPGGDIVDEKLDLLTQCLDNTVRDLGV